MEEWQFEKLEHLLGQIVYELEEQTKLLQFIVEEVAEENPFERMFQPTVGIEVLPSRAPPGG